MRQTPWAAGLRLQRAYPPPSPYRAQTLRCQEEAGHHAHRKTIPELTTPPLMIMTIDLNVNFDLNMNFDPLAYPRGTMLCVRRSFVLSPHLRVRLFCSPAPDRERRLRPREAMAEMLKTRPKETLRMVIDCDSITPYYQMNEKVNIIIWTPSPPPPLMKWGRYYIRPNCSTRSLLN